MLELVIKIFQMFADGQLPITKDTTIHDMNALPYQILDLATVIIIIQVIYDVDIPGTLMETPDLTIEEFVREVGKLQPQEDELFIARTMKLGIDRLDWIRDSRGFGYSFLFCAELQVIIM